ncbi:hypothetical protein HOL21_02640 [Candidatus Woesearchaeota archaeon]|jgi:hypothetical protein|nr:hypothetical protein [Candidatus Woesearchaeota archaeon]MBT5397086.1 hypothetical protein [Candidatus Woesearchaeota archaeon]MBT6367368.1 hypothetical protein [Candidatus Woesearchaeota archaeon]MBT7762486.1 hypothetical protein [Candidatus Woesearchaeota archaeon]
MKYNIDCHFHPNISRNDTKAVKQCTKRWNELKEKNVTVVISTEHAYKNPERAYKFMQKTKPENCFLFPGVEYVTKENVDLIIFSDNERIYTHKELEPFTMTLQQTVDFVSKNNLYCSVPHPHTLGLTSILKKKGVKEYQKYAALFGAVEISNTAFENLRLLFSLPILRWFSKKKIISCDKTSVLPKEDYPQKYTFLTAGSDAHFYGEAGTYITVSCTSQDLFQTIVTNKNPEVTVHKQEKIDFRLLVRGAHVALTEFLIKLRIKVFR